MLQFHRVLRSGRKGHTCQEYLTCLVNVIRTDAGDCAEEVEKPAFDGPSQGAEIENCVDHDGSEVDLRKLVHVLDDDGWVWVRPQERAADAN